MKSGQYLRVGKCTVRIEVMKNTIYTAHEMNFRIYPIEVWGERYIAEAEAEASKIYTERKKKEDST